MADLDERLAGRALTDLSDAEVAALRNDRTFSIPDYNRMKDEVERRDRQQPTRPVKIVGVDIGIGDLVALLFKLLIAGIPVGIAIGFVWWVVLAMLRG